MTEQLAVGAIFSLCGQDDVFLKPNIPIGDKEMSYDGGIEIHEDHSESKKSYMARVPVQIKGRSVAKHTKKSASFKVSLADLRIYLKNNGVLFLKVELEKSNNMPKVFYKSLLNLDIQRLLDNTKSEDATIKLLPIKDGKELRRVCLSFIKQQERQTSNVMGRYTLEDAKGSNSFRLTSVNLVQQGNPEKLLETEYYAYVVDEKDMEWPAGITSLSELTKNDVITLEINGKTIDFDREVIYTRDGKRTRINKAIEIVSTPSKVKGKENIKLALLFDKIESLAHFHKCLIVLEFMLKSPSFKEKSTNNKIPIESILEDFDDFKNVFIRAGIPLDLKIYPFKSEGLINRYFTQLKKIVLNEDLSEIEYVGDGIILNNVKFGDAILTMLIRTTEEGNKIYMPHDEVFRRPIVANAEGRSEAAKISLYIGQDPEVLFKVFNVTTEQVFQAFSPDLYDYTDFSFEITNTFALKLINTYDSQQVRASLELANYIYVNYIDSQDMIEKDIAKINHYQCLVRMDVELSDAAVDSILSIREAHPENEMMKFSCNVLLQNKHDAKRTMSKMENEVKAELLSYPIFNLYESLN